MADGDKMLKDLVNLNDHISCRNYKVAMDNGFRYFAITKGEKQDMDSAKSNYIFFFLEGDYSISCNGSKNVKFTRDQMILIPRDGVFHGEALTDCKLVIMGFDDVESGCDKFYLQEYEEYCATVKYEFKPVPVRYPLTEYLHLLTYCLRNGMNCMHLHEIKHREFFIYMRGFYTFEEVADMFHPIVGGAMDFRELMMRTQKTSKNVEDLIEASHLSRSAFFSKFKAEFGVTAKEWMQKQLSREILLKIQDPSVAIKDIIYEYDFASYPSFNRFCQKQFHCTPTELVNAYKVHPKK
jgi:AraC-like DNA-binding protein